MNRMVKKFMVVLMAVFMVLGTVTTPVQAKGNSNDTNGWNPWGGWRWGWGWGWQQPTEPEPEPEPEVEETSDEEEESEEAAETEEEIVETPAEEEPAVEETETVEETDPIFLSMEPEEQIDGLTVAAEYPEGLLPEGAYMTVTEVSLDAVQNAVDNAAELSGTVVAAVDITFYTAEGTVINDLGDAIKITMTSEEIAKVENPQVVHVDTSAEEIEAAEEIDVEAEPVEVNGETETAKDTVVFDAEHFSVYAVIDGDGGENARAKVNFYNGNTLITTYYIKNSDVLLGDGKRNPGVSYLEDIVTDPGVGTLGEKELFRGWTVDPDYTTKTQPLTIDGVRQYLNEEVIGNIVEGDTVNIYAMVFKFFSVTYYGLDEGISLGSDTVLYLRDKTEADYTVNKLFTADVTAKFMGWKASSETFTHIKGATSAETVYPNETEITLTDDVVFNVYAPAGRWLVYNENANGATYNAPSFVLDGDVTEQPATATQDYMSCNGYSFVDWYVLKEGASIDDVSKDAKGYYIIDDEHFERFDFGYELTAPITNIYAKWQARTVAPYTVVFWTESSSSIGKETKVYDLKASYTGDGTVGTHIPYTFVNNQDEDYVTVGGSDYHYTGFCLKEDSQNVQVTITPEGDAVLNLYYDRIQYNYRFYLYRRQGNSYSYAQNSAGGQNIWGIVNWYNNVSSNALPRLSDDSEYTIQTDTVDGYTAYYIVMQAYYGEDISGKWPTYDEIIGPANNRQPVSYVMMNGTGLKPSPSSGGNGTLKGIVTQMNRDILGATNDVNGNFVIVRFNSYNNWTYHLYFETIPGEDYSGYTTRTLNGKTYYLREDFTSRSSNTIPGDQNPPGFPGFDHVKNNNGRPYFDGTAPTSQIPQQNGVSGYEPYLNYYYDRLAYPINYKDGVYVGGNQNTDILAHHEEQFLRVVEGIPFESPIADEYADYIPTNPNETGYVFEGWYADAACNVKYEFTTMPEDGIIVYAKWVQKQYRIFLHPNAENSETNPELDWGTTSQQMNFRISYGKKVSTPTGIWTGRKYEMVGWFTDEACEKNPFNGDVFVLNDNTVTEEYDKTAPENYTDVMDQWGNGATYNNDVDRWWITKKLDIYALWREVLVGADGINVEYNPIGFDVNDTDKTVTGTINQTSDIFTDPLVYLDKARAVSTAASKPDDSDYQFLYWVVQEWDESENDFVDVIEDGKRITVSPGDSFNVLAAYAHRYENDDSTPDDPSFTYIVRLRAEYVLKDAPTPTHITWYGNGGTLENAVVGVKDKYGATSGEVTTSYIDLQINEKVPAAGANTFERSGYKFVGWAKVDEPAGAFDSETNEVDESKYSEVESDSLVLWLEYDEANSTYNELDENGVVINEGITEVAADEKLPYHALYAVWEHKYFYVFHSSDATLEAIALPDTETFNIVEKTNDGTLYGGYYSAYVDLNADSENVVAAKANAVQAKNKTAAVENAPTYDGSLLKPAGSSVRFWVKANAWTEAKLGKGNSIPVSGINEGDVFFLKEVPDTYLNPYLSYVYNYYTNVVSHIYLITSVDDTYYQKVGYYVANNNGYTAKLSSTFSYKRRNDSDLLTTLRPQEIFDIERGYLGVCGVSELINNPPVGYVKTIPYWVTLDGVEIQNDKIGREVLFSNDATLIDYTPKP